MSASSKPRPMWVRSLWAGWLAVSTPQGRAGWARWGESRQHRLPRKTPRAQGSGGGGGGGGGGGLGREGSPRSRVGTRADTCFCRQQNFKWAEAAAVLVRPSSVKSKQGWLTVSVISERASGCGR